MNLTEIRVVVRDYINNNTADVDQHVTDAVNFLSNFFSVKKIDTSEVTVDAQDFIAYADDFLKLRQLSIDGTFIKELLSDELLGVVDSLDVQLWHIADGKVQLTSDMSGAGNPIVMYYNAKFIQPELAVDTDVPDRLLELIYVGAAYRYFDRLAAIVATNREDSPDIKPAEIDSMRKVWKERFDSLLKDCQ